MMENGLDGDAKGGIAVVAMVTLLFRGSSGILRLTVRTSRFAMPPCFFKVVDTIRFGREKLVDSNDVHGHYLLMGYKLAQGIVVVKRNLLP